MGFGARIEFLGLGFLVGGVRLVIWGILDVLEVWAGHINIVCTVYCIFCKSGKVLHTLVHNFARLSNFSIHHKNNF